MSHKTRKTTELFIVMPNSLGSLTRVTYPLQKNGVNIEGYCAYEWDNEAAYRIITDDNKKAQLVLANEGFNITENQTVVWETNNKPGALKKATEALANNKINIFCSYCTTMAGGKKAATAFTTDDANKTFNTLISLA